MSNRFATTYAALDGRYPAQMRFLRFLVSGGMAAVVDLFFLYILTDGLRIWYLLSSILAFLAAFSVSFALQKRWTFRDRSNDRLHIQAPVYFAITALNLGLNTLLMYIFVRYFGIQYLISQIIVGALIAVESYFAYKMLVFRTPSLPPP